MVPPHESPLAAADVGKDSSLSRNQRWLAYLSGGLLGLAIAVALLALVVVAYL